MKNMSCQYHLIGSKVGPADIIGVFPQLSTIQLVHGEVLGPDDPV